VQRTEWGRAYVVVGKMSARDLDPELARGQRPRAGRGLIKAANRGKAWRAFGGRRRVTAHRGRSYEPSVGTARCRHCSVTVPDQVDQMVGHLRRTHDVIAPTAPEVHFDRSPPPSRDD